MQISVLESDWGEANRDDIRILLEDVASHIVRELRHPFDEAIRVVNLPTTDNPRAFYRGPHEDVHKVNLTAKDRKWSRFAYQFAHEFCHVRSGHERLRNNPNNWLHEAICELASIFTLRRMGERWRTEAPYTNWTSYSESLAAYAESLVEKYSSGSPTASFGAWVVRKRGRNARMPLSSRQERRRRTEIDASVRGVSAWLERRARTPGVNGADCRVHRNLEGFCGGYGSQLRGAYRGHLDGRCLALARGEPRTCRPTRAMRMIDGLHLLPTWLPRGKTRWPDRPVDPPLSAALEAFPPGILGSGATPPGAERVKTRMPPRHH